MSLAGPTLAMIQRSMPRERVGTVAAVNTSTGRCDVTVAGEVLPGLPWVGSAPVAGNLVSVARGVVSVLSASAVVVQDPVTVVVPWLGQIRYSNETVGDSPPPHPPYGWMGPAPTTAVEELIQGNAPLRGDAPPYDPGVVWRLEMSVWADPSTLLPAGATEVRLLLRARRTPNWLEPDVSPVIWGHAYTMTTPGPTDAEPTLAPGPWRPGGLAPGWRKLGPPNEWGSYPILASGDGPPATFPLPADLQTGLLAQTLTGLALWTQRAEETAGFRLELLLSYTPPPDPGP